MEFDNRAVKVKPSERQLTYMESGFHCFIHYSMNTYTGREWGDGKESPEWFCPQEIDTDEWVRTAKAAGMKGIILTCKHHDGFCLWPSQYTDHSIKKSPYKNGQGDIVKELSDSCRQYGMKFGVYLSPWDRNSRFYGSGQEYNDYYVAQLTELLTNYGEIFAVWMDGACGEGTGGKRQVYDWNRYYEVVRRLQPNAVISICGPDVRWCGNEAGQARKDEWSVVSEGLCNPELTGELSQQNDDAEFRQRPIDATMEDLGSREVLKNEERLIYYPSEMDVSIRPGWFYHKAEDNMVRSAENLFDLYLASIGHNAALLLNIPVMPDGHMHPRDIENAHKLGEMIDNAFSKDLALQASIFVKNGENQHGSYCVGKGPQMGITLTWDKEIRAEYLVLKENIFFSQRVERYTIAYVDKFCQRRIIKTCSTIGYQEIIYLGIDEVKCIEIQIEDSRVFPVISEISVY